MKNRSFIVFLIFTLYGFYAFGLESKFERPLAKRITVIGMQWPHLK